ncbi:hypothetical protein E3N88_00487 [Mikania micrantha]|uniref:Uncharacterized protein n=1 Tax=Mikania micrantha TaxID=192012 RepID=A0A5N6Q060_9ASTR|nr:hypothetical protein E3N88_00486 [Mikania micrantha]KAD7477351.1 hypothetical protein E3N88_00487 [Mikania micrantha]
MELMNMMCKVVFKGIDSEGVSGTKRPGKEVVIEDSTLEQGLGVSYGGAGSNLRLGSGLGVTYGQSSRVYGPAYGQDQN